MTVNEKAYAKINLFLDVVGKRGDGFHDIKSIMQTVSLSDELEVSAIIGDSTEIELSLTVSDELSALGISPETLGEIKDNLVFRAARSYLEKAGISAFVCAKLHKRIPVAAGLAGGSADAAAMLRALNKIFGKCTFSELSALAAELGSDIPFCLSGGTALCTGRGENIVNLSYTPELQVVIAIGKAHISTARAYAALDFAFSDFDGSVESEGKSILQSGENTDCDGIGLSAVRRADKCVYNIFEHSGLPEMDEVQQIKARLRSLGATATLMSGSGPSVFGIFETKTEAEKATETLLGEGIFAVSMLTVRM